MGSNRAVQQEAISHAKAADVPIVIAMKYRWIKHKSQIQRWLKAQLAEHGITPIDWGGAT